MPYGSAPYGGHVYGGGASAPPVTDIYVGSAQAGVATPTPTVELAHPAVSADSAQATTTLIAPDSINPMLSVTLEPDIAYANSVAATIILGVEQVRSAIAPVPVAAVIPQVSPQVSITPVPEFVGSESLSASVSLGVEAVYPTAEIIFAVTPSATIEPVIDIRPDIGKATALGIACASVDQGVYHVTMEQGGPGFMPGDLIRAERIDYDKDGNQLVVYRIDARVIRAVKEAVYELAFLTSVDTAYFENYEEGIEFVRIGNATDPSRQASILMTSTMADGPYIDIINGVDSPDTFGTFDTVKFRAGNLIGLEDPAFTIDPADPYGVYTRNFYGKGVFQLEAGSTGIGNMNDAGALALLDTADWRTQVDGVGKPDDYADETGKNTAKDIINLPSVPSGAPGLFADGTALGYHDGTIWKVYIQNDGQFYFYGNNDNKLIWNLQDLLIRGALHADDIVSGRVLAQYVQVGQGTEFTDEAYNPASKNVFRQDTAPQSGMVTNDLWIDTSDVENKMHVYDGSAWVETFGGILASSITASYLSAIAADLGSVTAGEMIIGETNKIWFNESGDGAIAVGGSVKADAPFYLTPQGKLLSADAEIEGLITATGGQFTGAVKVGTETDYILLDGANQLIQSSNYANLASGFLLEYSGHAEFNDIVVRNGDIDAVIKTGNYLVSENWDPTNEVGWAIEGDGDATFYGTLMALAANIAGTLTTDVATIDDTGISLDGGAGSDALKWTNAAGDVTHGWIFADAMQMQMTGGVPIRVQADPYVRTASPLGVYTTSPDTSVALDVGSFGMRYRKPVDTSSRADSGEYLPIKDSAGNWRYIKLYD